MADHTPFNPHPEFPSFTITVRRPESTDEDMHIMFVYLLSDQMNQGRYVGITSDIPRRMSVNYAQNNLESPLYRHLREHGIEGWSIHEYAMVVYDKVRCPDAIKHAENDAMAVLRSRGCALLNKNSAIRTSRAGVKQREWREANGQGTGDSYMANYCRQWRAQKKLEREQVNI